MNPFSPPDADGRLIIYLNDHRAMISAEISMAQRCRSSNEGSLLAHKITEHIGRASEDLALVDEAIDAKGGSVDHVKTIAAIAGERLGRFKTNGQLTGYSPLARVIELEALIAATHERAALWNTFVTVEDAAVDPDVARRRSDSTDDQVAELRSLHQTAVRTAFDDEERADNG